MSPTIRSGMLALAILLAGTAPASAQDSYEPNDTFDQAAGPLASGMTIESYIFTASDVDWFFFEADTGTVEIQLTNIPAGQDYDLSLWRSDGSSVVNLGLSDNADNLDEFLLVQINNEPQRLLVLVDTPGGSFSPDQPYRLRVTYPQLPVNTPPEVLVTFPNGGESLTVGTEIPITYTAVDIEDGADLSLQFEYSVNGGNSWIPVAEGQANTGEFGWLVPDAVTTGGRIRVTATDSALLTGSDVSDAVFSIEPAVLNTPPTVAVLAPNGGEVLTGGAQGVIAFTANDGQDGTALAMSFELSLDNGASWCLLASDVANTGSYAWAIPDLNTDSARIRVTALDSGGLSAADSSAAPFSIRPSLPPGSATLALAEGVEVVAGESVSIPLSLIRDQAITGTEVTVVFDPAILTPTEVVKGSGAGSMALSADLATPGQVVLTLAASPGDPLGTGTGVIAEITFATSPSAGGTEILTLADAAVTDAFDRPMSVSTGNGSVSISGTVTPNLVLILPTGLAASPGSTLDLPITFESNVPVTHLEFVLNFDETVLLPTEVTGDARTAGMQLSFDLLTPGSAAVAFDPPPGGSLPAGTGVACNIRFQVLEQANANTDLEFSDTGATGLDETPLSVSAVTEVLTPVRELRLRAESRGAGIILSWSADPDAAHLGYRVLRAATSPPAPAHPGILEGDRTEFLDLDVETGVTYQYWLEAFDRNGSILRSGPVSASLPRGGLRAGMPFPNPSRDPVTLEVRSDQGQVTAVVVDAAGRRVRRLNPPSVPVGTVRWDGTLEAGVPAPAGIYFLVVRAGDSKLTRRVVRTGS